MTEVQCLTPEGCTHTTTDMWRGFCRRVVDVDVNSCVQFESLVKMMAVIVMN